MVRPLQIVLCSAALVLSAGCNRLPLPFGSLPTEELDELVVVEPMTAEEDGTPRYKATLVAQRGYTVSDHAVALMMAASERCDGSSFSLLSHRALYAEPTSLPAAGTPLWTKVTCGRDLLPNHVEVATGTHRLAETSLPDTDTKVAWMLVRDGYSDAKVVESLLGGFVREVATEDCAGKALVIERIATGTEKFDDERAAELGADRAMHATMHFRCIDPPAPAAAAVAAAR
jgi:hypothetical protein